MSTTGLRINAGGGRSASVTINGTTYVGNNISITDGCIVVDGKDSGEPGGPGAISVVVKGDVQSVETVSGDIVVEGNASSVETVSGDVEIYGVVGRNVQTVSGDVTSGDIHGNVSTMSGNIARKH